MASPTSHTNQEGGRPGDANPSPQPGYSPNHHPTLHGVPLSQPPAQGMIAHAQPLQHVQRGGPQAQMASSSGMMQPQAGQPTHQNHMLQAQRIMSEYQATNTHAQYVQSMQRAPQQVGQAVPMTQAVNQPRPGPRPVPDRGASAATSRAAGVQGQPGIQPGAQPRPAQARPAAPAQGQVANGAVDFSRVFKTKLFALAKEDSEIHDLWYAHGRKIKEQNPELGQKEWFQRIVKSVFDEVRADKRLYHKIWSYNENAPRQQETKPAVPAMVTAAAAPQTASGQQAQPLVPAVCPVAPGAPRPVVGTAVPLGAAAPGTGGVRPSQAMPLQAPPGAHSAQQYAATYPGTFGARPSYTYHQYAQPGGIVRPGMPMQPQFTEEQRRKQEMERQQRDEQKRKEAEERRQRNIEEQNRKAQAKREKEEALRRKKEEQEAEKTRKRLKREEDKRKRDQERERKKAEREQARLEKQGKSRRRPTASKNTGFADSVVLPGDDGLVPQPDGVSQGKKRPPPRRPGTARKKAKADDQPAGIAIDMDTEEAALLGAMLKMGQQHGHKSVLEADAVLNDAPLRARLVHVAAQHGVRLVHTGAVKACSLAVELYLRKVLQDMIRMHEIRTGQAKDVPGMVRDLSRNWARDVAIIAEGEKEAQARARHAQQLQEDQQTIAAHASRRRGEELDDEEKAKRKENVDAARSRLGTAEAQNRVNENLKKMLPQRRFGQGRRLLGGKMSALRAGKQLNVMGPLAAKPATGTEPQGAAPADGAHVPDANPPAAVAENAGPAWSRQGVSPEGTKKAMKQTLTMQDMLATLRRNPAYAHSQLHYKFLQIAHSAP